MMTTATVIELMRQAFLVGLILSMPLLLVSLIVGLTIGILQAAMGVQEFTLTFVPKVLAVFAVLLLFGSLGLSTATEFTVWIFSMIPQVVR